MTFPTVNTQNLLREKRRFPDELEGRFNLILIGYERHHQDAMNTWFPLGEALEEENKDVRFYEMPVISDRNVFSRWFIDQGMRSGIPDEKTRARTYTLYLDKERFNRQLDIPNEREIHVLLVSQDGNVLWRTSGAYDESTGEEIRTIVAQEPVPAN